MLAFLREQVDGALEQPVEKIFRPALKAVVAIALLATAAHWVQERSLDRKSLAVLATKAVSEPARTGSLRK